MSSRSIASSLALAATIAAGAATASAQEFDPTGPSVDPSQVPMAPAVETAPMPPQPMPMPPPSEASMQHAWIEARLGTRRWTEKSTGFGGGGFDLALGLAWEWVDVGIVGSYSSTNVADEAHAGDVHASVWTIGPEIATRTSLGGGATFRLAFDPLYALETVSPASTSTTTHSLVGGNLLAQVLFTVDESTRPVWRFGIGAHVGKMWPTAGATSAPSWDQAWIVGADLILRSWW